jgi:spore coat protein A, manganese oxidase
MKNGRMSRRELFKYTAALGITLSVPWRAAGIASAERRAGLSWANGLLVAADAVPQTHLPGSSIPKYVEPLPVFGSNQGLAPDQVNAPRVTPDGNGAVTVTASEVQQKILPEKVYPAGSAGTYVWAYNVGDTVALYPGITIEAQRNQKVYATYINSLPATESEVQKRVIVDQSIHWANPDGLPMMVMNSSGAMIPNPARQVPYSGPPPMCVHLHGAEVASSYDGGPEQWYTPDGKHGPGYRTLHPLSDPVDGAMYEYVNEQEATTLWFHDHALGATRLNVYAGMAAFYLLRDQYDTGVPDTGLNLPAGEFEREIAFQDRQFDTCGQWFFPHSGETEGLNGPPPNPWLHPYWNPEFFGDVFVVNGKSWPYLNVQPRRYRFRMLGGCNARFLELRLMNRATHSAGPAFWVIGTDGGLLDKPVKLNDPTAPASKAPRLLIAPGERYDVIIDFAGYAGQTLTLVNSAKAPYPMGTAPDPNTTAEIMQFRVTLPMRGTDNSFNPAAKNATLRGGSGKPEPVVRLVDPAKGTLATGVMVQKTRLLTLVEVEGDGGPEEVLVNNTKWDGLREGTEEFPEQNFAFGADSQGVTELPQVGGTEIWEIVNTTMDAHPIHLHLTQFQLMNRQAFNATQYRALYDSLFPGLPEVDEIVPPGEVQEQPIPAGVFIPGFGSPLPYDGSDARSGVDAWGRAKLGGNPDVTPFLSARVRLPLPEEAGWKDTVKMYPGEVTRIVVRLAPQDTPPNGVQPGKNLYGFNPTTGPGYVWHCHIVDHEDNEMMRPYHPVM